MAIPMTEGMIAVIGAGTMGVGIAQLAASNGHKVLITDSSEDALFSVKPTLEKTLKREVEKGRVSTVQAETIANTVEVTTDMESLSDCSLFIEAVVEKLSVKQDVFKKLERVINNADSIIATNTSSLSITAVASACKISERVVGIHFFNPAYLMPLVEIIPGLTTSEKTSCQAQELIDSWGKVTVVAKDSPGFIVNRVARPFYGEALRIHEEGIADIATIDWAMRECGGFRMGPFELIDLIGVDVNYAVSEQVFKAFYYDPRYKPSIFQKRLVEANLHGRKLGRGFYPYEQGANKPLPTKDIILGNEIFHRILVMLINEAAEAVFLGIASVEDIDLAMKKGVNYPKGLLKWADEIGLAEVLSKLNALQDEYGEDRYRASAYLKRLARKGENFYANVEC